jgi:hypothetical protein
MRPDRIGLGAARPQLVLFGEGEGADPVEPADGFRRFEPMRLQLLAKEARTGEEVPDLLAVERIVLDPLPRPGKRFDRRLLKRGLPFV